MNNNDMFEQEKTFIPERIAKFRNDKKVSARDMSLSLALNENYISKVESGEFVPSYWHIFANTLILQSVVSLIGNRKDLT